MGHNFTNWAIYGTAKFRGGMGDTTGIGGTCNTYDTSGVGIQCGW